MVISRFLFDNGREIIKPASTPIVNAVAQPAKKDEGYPSKTAKKYNPQAKQELIKTIGNVASTPITVLTEKLRAKPPKNG